MGLVNLGLLILFFIAIYKILTMRKSVTDLVGSLNLESPFRKEISREMNLQDQESRSIEREEKRGTKLEIRTLKDIDESLMEIVRSLQANSANLTTQDRVRIADKLKKISGKEDVFLKTLQNLKHLLQSLRIMDGKQIQEMKNRLARTKGNEKQTLEKEIFIEEEKTKVEQDVLFLEQRLEKELGSFNSLLHQAVQVLNGSAYPADAISYLSQARTILKDIMSTIEKMRTFEDRLLQLTKSENNLLRTEAKKA